MSDVDLDALEALHKAATPGKWFVYRMTKDGSPITPEDFGEYAKNCVIVSAKESGSLEVLAIYVEKPDGGADVCHVGNGPTSPQNASFIAAAHESVPALIAELREARAIGGSFKVRADIRAAADEEWEREVEPLRQRIAELEAGNGKLEGELEYEKSIRLTPAQMELEDLRLEVARFRAERNTTDDREAYGLDAVAEFDILKRGEP